jgi:threonine/homoserine/homoserine lactone efflux protein
LFTCGEERGLMEFWIFFVKGVIAGFIIAMPVGPVAIMCIHRTLVQGALYGYVSGLGAAIGDTVFGAIAAFGLGFLADDLMAHNQMLRFIGGAILCLLGIRAMLTRRLPDPATDDRRSYFGDGASALFVTITNPITLISFAAVLAGLNIHGVADHMRWSVALTWGVFTGACGWWFLLTTVTRGLRGFMTDRRLLWVTRATGALIILFGGLLLFSLISIDAETFGEKLQRTGTSEPVR